MAPNDSKRAYRRDMLLAGVMVAAGFAISGAALAQLATPRHAQMAQATQPLAIDAGRGDKTVGARRAGNDGHAA